MSLEGPFQSMCAGLGVPDGFQKLLVAKGVLSVEDFAMMATVEAEVKSDIFPFAKAGGAELVEVKEQIAVNKLWLAARKDSASTGPQGAWHGNTIEEEGIPKETNGDLKQVWLDKHGFVLPDSWMVTASLQKRIWRAVNATPVEVEVLLMEQLRMHSQRTRVTGTLLNYVPGQPVSTSAVDVDSIYVPTEIACRAKAWFMTTAYVCIRKRDWFDLQTAIFASDKIQDLVLCPSGGAIPPVDHFNNAWTATVHHFSEQVRISGQSLKSIVNNTGGLEKKWQWNNPDKNNTVADLRAHVAQSVGAVRELARRQEQSMRDKQKTVDRAGGQRGKGDKNGKGGKQSFKHKRNGDGGRGADDRGRDDPGGHRYTGSNNRDRSHRR